MRRYLETRVPSAEDPLTLMTRLAGSGLFTPYVVYENGPEWALAGGELASVQLRDPAQLRHVGERLAATPVAHWRAYGWAAFELGAGAPAEETLLHLIVPADEIRADADGVLVRALTAQRLGQLTELVRTPGTEGRRTEAAPDDTGERIEVALDDTGNYRAAVAAAVVELAGPGELEKVVVSRRVPLPDGVDLAASYTAGRRANTPARSFLLDLGGVRAAGFSPETVAEVTAGGQVTTRPLAGTRARTGRAEDDARLRAELLGDPKEIHEHAISVKLALEELGTVCDETVVTDYMTVLARGTVQHLASTVTGRLRPGNGPWDAFAALFPAVTATGVPKAAAFPLIAALEGRPRGLYSGAVLTCDADGTLDAALVLRSLFHRDGHSWLQAGAGVVRQSTPEREHEETCEKLRSVAGHLVGRGERRPPSVA